MVRIVSVRASARRAVAALPVLALTSAGIAFAASSDELASRSLSVPDQAVTQQAGAAYPQAGPAPAPMQLPPIYDTYTRDWARVDLPSAARDALHAVASLAPVRLDANGIPSLALAAYQRAAGLLDRADPGCGLDWALLGAIGRVESNHARFGGNVLDADGVAQPGIIGVALDGSRGTARILDTDRGAYDRDRVYDRAVGPMQVIPTTWAAVGRDGDGDGVANPQSLTDAVTAAGVLLCSGGGNLREPGNAYRAVLRYNHSDDYAHRPHDRRRLPTRRLRGPRGCTPGSTAGRRLRHRHPCRVGLRVCRHAGFPGRCHLGRPGRRRDARFVATTGPAVDGTGRLEVHVGASACVAPAREPAGLGRDRQR